MNLKRFLTIACTTLCVGASCLALAACGPEIEPATTATVRFDVNTAFQTNVLKDKTVTLGKRVSRPNAYIIEENPTNLQVYGWYTDMACTDQWDFKKDRVNEDMTLYAKWVELYNVNYYVNGELVKEDTAFNGDLVEEDKSIVEGYKYLGSYVDEECTQEFDYTKPISKSCNIYVKRSPGIYLSDVDEEGNVTGDLTNVLAAYVGSYGFNADGSTIDQDGWVEEYTIKHENEDGTVTEEACTYVNFGYTPTYGDGFVEISQGFDISQSQIIRMTYKNLGKAESVCVYFTTMLDLEDSVYSATGPVYIQEFCYPNHTGNPGARLSFTEEQQEMDETDEWQTVDFNLYEIYKKGYSVWGTSPFLGSLRIQVTYKSDPDQEDWSNEFLIKSIEGIPVDIQTVDGIEVDTIRDTASKQTPEQIAAVADAQASDPNGFIFPKDYELAGDVVGDASLQNSKAGLLFYSINEIANRANNNASTGFTINVPETKSVDLGEYTTLNIRLRNYGYADKLTVLVYNNKKVPVRAQLSIATEMQESKTYSINLYGKFGMSGNLLKVEILYDSVGVDNLLLIESVNFGEFVPYDTLGINFNDKNCYGFASNSDVGVSFESGMEGIRFDVVTTGAVVESVEKPYKATNDGYAKATLHYYLYKSSNVEAVIISYKVNGSFGTEYRYELDQTTKGKNSTLTVPFELDERGYVKSVRIRFEGTGAVVLQQIEYGVGEFGLPFYKTYQPIFGMMGDWMSNVEYSFDEIRKASVLTKLPIDQPISMSLYIGYSKNWQHIEIPHETKSVLIDKKTTVKLIYQNTTDVPLISLTFGFANSDTGSGESELGTDFPSFDAINAIIDTEMGEYEWSVLTIEIPESYIGIGAYLSKVRLQFGGKEIAIRGFAIEQ